jgi:hypothetical protein
MDPFLAGADTRLPDTGSSGPGIHSSSEGSVCGDLKLSAIFKICVHPICHKNEYTSVDYGNIEALASARCT